MLNCAIYLLTKLKYACNNVHFLLSVIPLDHFLKLALLDNCTET